MTQPTPTRTPLWRPTVLVFGMAMVVYAMGGNMGRLFHDDAIFFYGGQEMLRGNPVYLGIFDHKGPLGQMVCGLGVWLAGVLGKNDLITTRYLFLAIASATAAGVFVLGAHLFRSRLHGFLASAVFVSFWGYGALAFSGTRPKMVMALFEVWSLVLLAHRRWFLTGAAIALGAFAWQPMGIFFGVALFLAWTQSEGAGQRRGAVLRLVAGALVPTLAMCAYFLLNGAFGAFLDGCFLFNLRYLENPGSFGDQVASLLRILIFNGMGVVTLFGLLTMPVLFVWRLREREAGPFLRDRFAGLLLTFPFPVLWSLHDFQQYPDFFIFLPYVALGMGWVAHTAASGLGQVLSLSGSMQRAWIALPGVVLVLFSCVALRFASNQGLSRQWGFAREFELEFGDARIAAIGRPEAPALLQRSNVTRYGFIMRGIAGYIDANEPGGFAGWLQSITDAAPEVLIVEEDYADLLGEYADEWTAWLATYERRAEPIGPWTLYLPR